jgi:RNA polymerase sigma-70 factor (sigma-E family)
MSRAAERDAAYVEFVRARSPHLRRVAYACCGDRHRAEDLLQTALIKLYVAWPRLRRDGREEAYVRTIIVRANVDESRRPWRRERPSEVLTDRPAPESLPVEERDALFEALQSLPEMQRKTVLLRHWLGLSVAETASELRIGEGTVKSHTSRGLAALAATLVDAELALPESPPGR